MKRFFFFFFLPFFFKHLFFQEPLGACSRGGAPSQARWSHTYLAQNLVLPLKSVWSGVSYLFLATFSFLICKMGHSFFPHRLFVGLIEIMWVKATTVSGKYLGWLLRASSPFSFTLTLCRRREERASVFHLLSYNVSWYAIRVILLQLGPPPPRSHPSLTTTAQELKSFTSFSDFLLMSLSWGHFWRIVWFARCLCSPSFPGTTALPSTSPSQEPCWCTIILSLETTDCSGMASVSREVINAFPRSFGFRTRGVRFVFLWGQLRSSHLKPWSYWQPNHVSLCGGRKSGHKEMKECCHAREGDAERSSCTQVLRFFGTSPS